MPAEPMVEQTLAGDIASLRQRKYEVPVIRDPDDVSDGTVADVEKRDEIGRSSVGLPHVILNFLRF